ncbi:hypothetical protein D3C76_1744030 [compost metagenome]
MDARYGADKGTAICVSSRHSPAPSMAPASRISLGKERMKPASINTDKGISRAMVTATSPTRLSTRPSLRTSE